MIGYPQKINAKATIAAIMEIAATNLSNESVSLVK
jgi:hypothetical protein